MDQLGGWHRIRRQARRVQSWMLCHLGRHLYARRRNPEVSGAAAMYEQCRRCGHERDAYGPPRAQYWFEDP